jgi:hypothetical protein
MNADPENIIQHCILIVCRDGRVGIVRKPWARRSMNCGLIARRMKMFLIPSKCPGQLWDLPRSTNPVGNLWSLSGGEYKADHSLPYFHSPIRLHGVHRDNFTSLHFTSLYIKHVYCRHYHQYR